MTADCFEESRDFLILQLLRQKQVSKYIIELLDSFTHRGPNGNHQCLVFELLGPTIDHVVADYGICEDRLEPEVILKVTRQLLHAVASMHKAGCAHGGDLFMLAIIEL
jgi:serine/threonine-protein kinase SRPK3